jgi:hypothetical protein
MANAQYPTLPYKTFVVRQFGLGNVTFFERKPVADLSQRTPLSFHAVSFGPDGSSASLRRMANLALDIQNNAPRDPLRPQAASVPSSFSIALDTVRNFTAFSALMIP